MVVLLRFGGWLAGATADAEAGATAEVDVAPEAAYVRRRFMAAELPLRERRSTG
jgi:hypothetical protein